MTPGKDPQTERTQGARRARQELVAGRIVRPHGVRGAVVLDPDTEFAERIHPEMTVLVGEDRAPRTVRSVGRHGRRFLLELDGATTREAAEGLRDAVVRIRADDVGGLPPNTYFRWQIIGLRTETEEGEALGTVVEVLETGANDVYEVEREGGGRLLLPAIASVVREIDLDAGVLKVRLLPGLEESTGGGTA